MIQTILEELVRYQKIACSNDCNAKNGIERVSIAPAHKEILKAIDEAIGESKLEFDRDDEYCNGEVDGYNQAKKELRTKLGLEK